MAARSQDQKTRQTLQNRAARLNAAAPFLARVRPARFARRSSQTWWNCCKPRAATFPENQPEIAKTIHPSGLFQRKQQRIAETMIGDRC